MEYTLKIIKENANDRYILCDYNENYYAISKLLYEILAEYKTSDVYAEICNNINARNKEMLITPGLVENSIKKAQEIIGAGKKTVTPKKNYIRNKIPIIREGKSSRLYQCLGLLFNQYIFDIALPLSIAISFLFFYRTGYTNLHFLYAKITHSLSVTNAVISYLLFIAIILIHELGHASASFKYGIRPKEIGAGLYFIFPVLYTNVTNIWALSNRRRIMVNTGGIYFQLLVNVILIIILQLNFFNDLIFILIISNSLSILVSLNPFFRYDGYWIFSDLFNTPNLREKSTKLMTNIFRFTKKKNTNAAGKTLPAIIIYSFLNVAFWLWVYFSIVKYLFANVPKLVSSLGAANFFSGESLSIILACFLFSMWFFTLTINFFIKFLKYNNHVK